jgi:hypothetical protein
MIYSYEQYVAIIEWINDLNYYDKKDERKFKYKLGVKRTDMNKVHADELMY